MTILDSLLSRVGSLTQPLLSLVQPRFISSALTSGSTPSGSTSQARLLARSAFGTDRRLFRRFILTELSTRATSRRLPTQAVSSPRQLRRFTSRNPVARTSLVLSPESRLPQSFSGLVPPLATSTVAASCFTAPTEMMSSLGMPHFIGLRLGGLTGIEAFLRPSFNANSNAPNHALQRTATAVTAPASCLRLSHAAQEPRQPPRSLSLGSLGVLA